MILGFFFVIVIILSFVFIILFNFKVFFFMVERLEVFESLGSLYGRLVFCCDSCCKIVYIMW